MAEGKIVALWLARVKGTPSEAVTQCSALAEQGLAGDRSCNPKNARQALVMDKETLDELGLKPGQIKENITTVGLDLAQTRRGQVFFIGEGVTLEIVGPCLPCHKMDAIRPGLQEQLKGRRGMLATVISGGDIKIGDAIRVEP